MTPQTPQPLVQISLQGFLLKLLKSHETCSRSPLTQVPSKKGLSCLSGPDPKSQESEVAANHSDDTRKLEGLDLLDPMSYT